MADVNEKVIDAEVKNEETGMATTTQPAAPEETKTDMIGKVKNGAKVVGAAALVAIAFCAGLAKGKAKAAKVKASNEDIVDAEPNTNSEDEVSE